MSSSRVLKREQGKSTNRRLNLTAYTHVFSGEMSLYSFYKSTNPPLVCRVSNQSDSYNYCLKRHQPSQCNAFNISKAKLKALLIKKQNLNLQVKSTT